MDGNWEVAVRGRLFQNTWGSNQGENQNTMTSQAPDTAPIRAGEELDWKSLEAYLREHLPSKLDDELDFGGRIEVTQFPGGHSNLTYCVRLGDREFVMRRPPFGPVAPTAHDMPREYRLLAAINPHFHLAPKPYLLCEDTSVIGAPFYLMERRRGVVLRQTIPPEVGEDLDLRRRISESMVSTARRSARGRYSIDRPGQHRQTRRLRPPPGRRLGRAVGAIEDDRAERDE